MRHSVAVLWLWLGGYAFLMYAVAPLLIRFNQKMPGQPRLEPITLAAMPPEAASYLAQTQELLADKGFAPVALLAMPGQNPNVFPVLSLLYNRATGDKASAVIMYTVTPQGVKLATRYQEFSARFDDDSSLTTNNNSTLGAFQADPRRPTYRLATVTDPRELYEIHWELVSRRASPAPKVLPPPGEEVAQYAESMREGYERQVRYGRLYYDRAAQCYRPTLRGAYLMTWGLLWPMKAVRLAQARRQAQAVLRSLGPAWRRTV